MESLIINIIEPLFFLLMAFSVGYLLFFAFSSLRKRPDKYPYAKSKYRFAVLFPAYKEDRVIASAVESFLQQKYPKEYYDIVVISDQMQNDTNRRLSEMPLILLPANYKESSKAKALNLAVNYLDASCYDVVVVMDADNTVQPDFLQELSNAYESGVVAMQAHRLAKNLNTDTAILDAVSEEINNSIFRKGHVRLGFSSALIGSGMAFDYKWFHANIATVCSVGEDKELEALLLKENIYIEYLEDVPVYDEKTQKETAFKQQRRRWLAAQYESLFRALPDLPGAIAQGNIDYCDKIVQWMMLPRAILLGLSGLFAVLLLFYDWQLSIKWWVLLFLFLFTFCLAIPDYLVDKRFTKALKKVPLLVLMMALGLFRIKGAGKKFIHTEHGVH